MKDMSREVRRHHASRLKQSRGAYWGHPKPGQGFDPAYKVPWTPRTLGMVIHTPKICSCAMCGNERKWLGSPTIQERRQSQEPLTLLLADTY